MHKKEIFLEIDANLHQPIQSMEADSNSRAIRFYLTSNYAPLNLRDKKVIFKAVKPDSTDIVNDCEIIDVEKGIVEIKVTKQLNAVPGRVNCQLSIIGANDYVLKTKKFGILVDSKLTESGIISSREYKTLENALSEVHEINKNFEQVNAKINEVATKGTTVEVIEEVTKEEIERQIADGTIAHLMIEDGSVTPEKTSFYDEIATQKNLLKNAEFDYMGNNQNTVKKAIDSSIDWVLGEVNTAHHEGQHITATDTIEGHAKSAILKGQTLVNISSQLPLTNQIGATSTRIDGKVRINFADYTWSGGGLGYNEMIKPSTKYLFKVRFTNTCQFTVQPGHFKGWHSGTSIVSPNETFDATWVITTRSDIDTYGIIYWILADQNPTNYQGNKYIDVEFLMIEYQEEMENWDIPYFEGMQSVKMPVLCTTGKNLFDSSTEIVTGQGINSSNGLPYNYPTHSRTGFLRVKPNTSYTITQSHNKTWVFAYDKNKEYIKVVKTDITSGGNFTTPNDTHYIRLDFNTVDTSEIVNGVQIEEGSIATPYEPYKSNILSTPEDLELRGIDDVKDTLDLTTGELTERIGVLTLRGENSGLMLQSDFLNQNNTIGFSFTCSDGLGGYGLESTSLSNHFSVYAQQFLHENDIEGVSQGFKRIYVRVYRDKLNTQDINGFKQWLLENEITVQYQLATPTVKTVVLSDNVVYSYKDTTHYTCSSEDGSLVPSLSIDVPTDLPALVSKQRATIESQKEQIATLEIENEQLIAQNELQDVEISLNQDAINFMLFQAMSMNLNENTKGVNMMAAYFANQILKGKLDYALVVSRYPEYKEDIDTILIAEGKQDLIK